MKKQLFVLLLIPSLIFSKTLEELYYGCKLTDEYKNWLNKNESVDEKRTVYIAKCILDHSKNSSSVPYSAIEESCMVLAIDKYKNKDNEPKKCIK